MKKVNWFGAAVALFFLLCAVAAPDYEPGQRFDLPPKYGGRPLTPAESTTVQRAIDSIRTRPPDSITFKDENDCTRTVSCSTIAADLQKQLRDSGRMEVETIAVGSSWTLPDCLARTNGDQMNIDPGALARAAQHDSNRRTLEGILVHEWDHKTQDSASLRDRTKAEIEPFSAMHAYYCSTRKSTVPPADDWLSKWAKNQFVRHGGGGGGNNPYIRPFFMHPAGNYYYFINHDTIAGGTDSLTSLSSGGTGWRSYPLTPLRGSDLFMFESHPFLPPGHSLAVVCGGIPISGVARILLLHVFNGQVIAPVMWHDFGPPTYPPMFFYSVVHSEINDTWYMLDTTNHQILTMQDAMYNDGVPDEITGIYASAWWPGMEPLLLTLGLEEAVHPDMGPGLLLVDFDVHFYDAHPPYDNQMFLMDTDGNQQADLMLPMPMCHFLEFTPVILPPSPWAGETLVKLFATWSHDINIWTTDSGGVMLIEMLGMIHMAPGVHAECLLSRPLLPGEYILSFDQQTGHRSWPPETVIDPTPLHLVIQLRPDGMLQLNWEAVPGAGHYEIYMSDDGVEFDNSGLISGTNAFVMPLPLPGKQFYQIRAVR